MWHLLLHAASLTLLLQGPLFVLVAAVGTFSIFRDRKGPRSAEVERAIPVLQPLTCDGCQAGLMLRSNLTRCGNCRRPVALTDAYEANARLRDAAQKRLREAVTILRRMMWLGSWTLKGAVVVAGLWLIATPVLFIIDEGTFTTYEPVFVALGNPVLYALIGTLVLWDLVLLLAFIHLPAGRELPVVRRPARGPDPTNCSKCRAPIEYAWGDLGTVCGYCGTPTFRAGFRASSLNEGAALYESTIADVVAVPGVVAILLALGVVTIGILAIVYGGWYRLVDSL